MVRVVDDRASEERLAAVAGLPTVVNVASGICPTNETLPFLFVELLDGLDCLLMSGCGIRLKGKRCWCRINLKSGTESTKRYPHSFVTNVCAGCRFESLFDLVFLDFEAFGGCWFRFPTLVDPVVQSSRRCGLLGIEAEDFFDSRVIILVEAVSVISRKEGILFGHKSADVFDENVMASHSRKLIIVQAKFSFATFFET